ncbi:hypothetical protein [Streptococcus mitis]|uniref:Lipoprotein n=1 Tax=Streptococcus mitis TaxID=28037 RepID=A0A7X1RMR0_STRMT|nr:hypothetical protein [Streptococcus mitis]MQQ51996.1 hypothetical protein [Streptococcus mitis]
MSNRGIKSVFVVIFISVMLLGGCATKNGQKKSSDVNVDTTTVNVDETTESSKNESSVEKKTPKFADDKVVNDFINNYNDISNSPLENIKKGNIKIKYFATSYGYYLELLHANDTDKINVTINQTNENSSSGVAGMKEVFHDIVKSIETSLSDDEVNNYFDNLVLNETITDSTLGSLKINYVPDKELSYGNSRGHIKVIVQ